MFPTKEHRNHIQFNSSAKQSEREANAKIMLGGSRRERRDAPASISLCVRVCMCEGQPAASFPGHWQPPVCGAPAHRCTRNLRTHAHTLSGCTGKRQMSPLRTQHKNYHIYISFFKNNTQFNISCLEEMLRRILSPQFFYHARKQTIIFCKLIIHHRCYGRLIFDASFLVVRFLNNEQVSVCIARGLWGNLFIAAAGCVRATGSLPSPPKRSSHTCIRE